MNIEQQYRKFFYSTNSSSRETMSMLHGKIPLPRNNHIFVITNIKPFGTPVNISNNPGSSANPRIVAS